MPLPQLSGQDVLVYARAVLWMKGGVVSSICICIDMIYTESPNEERTSVLIRVIVSSIVVGSIQVHRFDGAGNLKTVKVITSECHLPS